MSRNPKGINFFGPPLHAGRPLAQNVGLIDKINTLCAVLERLDGANGITLVRAGKQWAIVFNPSAVEAGRLTLSGVVDYLIDVDDTMTDPSHVLGKKTVGDVTTIGWVATCTHADEHPESA